MVAMQFRLASSLATVVRQGGRQLVENSSYGDCLKFYTQPPVSVFFFDAVFDVRWTNTIL